MPDSGKPALSSKEWYILINELRAAEPDCRSMTVEQTFLHFYTPGSPNHNEKMIACFAEARMLLGWDKRV